MSGDNKTLEKIIGNSLSGKGSHMATKHIAAGLNWRAAGTRPKGAPHSIYQVLNHMSYWQNWVVKWLDGGNPQVPKHASGGWPGESIPANAKEWQKAIRDFRNGLEKLARKAGKKDLLSKRGKHTRLGMLQAVASHNSYHVGQVVSLRQILGAWPPPTGGITW